MRTKSTKSTAMFESVPQETSKNSGDKKLGQNRTRSERKNVETSSTTVDVQTKEGQVKRNRLRVADKKNVMEIQKQNDTGTELKKKKKVTFMIQPRGADPTRLPDGRMDEIIKKEDVKTKKRKHKNYDNDIEDVDTTLISSLGKKRRVDTEQRNLKGKTGAKHVLETKEEMNKRNSEKNRKVKKKVSVQRNVKVLSLRTRISPHQLYMVVNNLTKKQKAAVKAMGFGKFLQMKTDMIPFKLGYFILDRFVPSNMEIRVNGGCIKVTESDISSLLGLRNSGIVLEENKTKTKVENPNKKRWIGTYGEQLITPSRVAARIMGNGEDDGLMFKYDFLTLVMNTMVEVKKDGRCNIEYFNMFDEDTQIEDVNWCAHICNMIKNSKNNWQRSNNSKYFNGAIPILMLLYVDKTTCGNLNKERTMGPLEFWTKDLLSMRESYEMKNGGFGRVEVRDSYVEKNMDDEGEQVNTTDDNISGMQKAHVDTLEDTLIALIHQKDDLKQELCRIRSLNPYDVKVSHLIGGYNVLFKDEIIAEDGNKNVNEMVRDIVAVINEGETSNADGFVDDASHGAKNDDYGGNVHNKGKKKMEDYDKTMPSFKLLSDSSQESNHENDDIWDLETQINKPLNEDERLLWKYVMITVVNKQRKDKVNNVDDKDNNVSDNDSEDVSDVEKEKREVELSFMMKMFETKHGMMAQGFTLNTLEFGKEISSNVVDCWAAMLNHRERELVKAGRRRLFCYTSTFPEYILKKKHTEETAVKIVRTHLREVFERDDKLLDLKEFDIIVIPIIEKAHFYLICMDLNTGDVQVIDNMMSRRHVYTVKESKQFRHMVTPCKVKNYMITYMASVKNPYRFRLAKGQIRKLKLRWATKENVKDCGVFAMRHMEMYRGSREDFECGFSDIEEVKQWQLNNMRMRIATTLMMSPANVYKNKVVELARKEVGSIKDKQTLKGLERLDVLQEECWNGLADWVEDKKTNVA